MKRELTIATPCYNEAETLPTYFERIRFVRERLTEAGWTVRLLLINDGSSDRTRELLEEHVRAQPNAEAAHHPRNLGYGAAIKTALALARTEWIVFVDADTNYDQAIVLDLAGRLTEEMDLLNVSIFAPGGRPAYPGYRRFLSRSATLIYRAVLPRLTRGIYTMTCGFRWYRRSRVADIFPRSNTFVATAEIMVRALTQGLRVVEVPAANSPRRYGQSKMRFISESLAHLRLACAALSGGIGPALPVQEHLRLIGKEEFMTLS